MQAGTTGEASLFCAVTEGNNRKLSVPALPAGIEVLPLYDNLAKMAASFRPLEGVANLAIRMKTHWHQSARNPSADKSLQDAAGALAFNLWRLAVDKAKNLHGEDYFYRTDGQRIAIICEFLAYMIQVTDRLAHERLDDDERRLFVNTLGQRVADHVQDNAADLFGPGDYRSGFIHTLNQRSQTYAEFGFGADGPSHNFMQFLGVRTQSIMGDSQINRWIINQVMEVDAPELYHKTHKALDDLLSMG